MSNTENSASLVGASEVFDRFNLYEEQNPSDVYKSWISIDFNAVTSNDSNFIVYNGDASIKGDFSLDIEDGELGEWEADKACQKWCEAFGLKADLKDTHIVGVIVDGNLNIDGSLFNFDDEQGALLFVTGNLAAKNIRAGGSLIHIVGNANIEECVYSCYNDGAMRIYGDLTTTVYINDEHMTAVSGKLTAPYRADSDENGVKNSAGFYFDDDGLVIPTKLEKLLSYKALPDGNLDRALSETGTIFRKPGDVPPELTEDEWLEKVKSEPKLITKKLPEKFKTEEFFCKLADKIRWFYGLDAIPYFPKECLTDKVCEHITATCEVVFDEWMKDGNKQNNQLLERIPDRFRSPSLLTKIDADNEMLYKIRHDYRLLKKLPKQFQTEEFFCKVADSLEDSHALQFGIPNFPEEYLSDKVCDHIMKSCERLYVSWEKDGIGMKLLDFIPDRFRSPSLIAKIDKAKK
jgi:hypothetical protein